ncbi:MAG: SelB C-terminal domain-containing protein, partial [Planctomycetaceae bacterium]|nr:SelB C-terminal domain-containing protein [Planctomycetaceae bacterium]
GAIDPGCSGFVDIRCQTPVLAEWGQRFILRSSDGVTLGGGVVLDPLPGDRRIREFERRCELAASTQEADRLRGILQTQPSVTLPEAAQRAGVFASSPEELLQSGSLKSQIYMDAAGTHWVHKDWLRRMANALLRAIRAELERQGPKRMLPVEVVRRLPRTFDGSRFGNLAIGQLIESGALVQRGNLIGPADQQVSLTKRQQEGLDLILQAISQQPQTPPTRKELQTMCGRLEPRDVEQLLTLCVEDGLLIPVGNDLHYVPGALESLRMQLATLFETSEGVTLAQMRDAFGMTRKHVVPLAEFFDIHHITERSGDLRIPGARLNNAIGQADC